MHETQERMQCNAVLATRSIDQTDKHHSQNYGPKEGCSTEMGFWFLIPFSLKCLQQRRLEGAFDQIRLSSKAERGCSRSHLLLKKCKQNHLAKAMKLSISWFYQIEHEIMKLKQLVLSFWHFPTIFYKFWKISMYKEIVDRPNRLTTPV